MKLTSLLHECKSAVEQAARDSYNDGDTDEFEGCTCLVDLANNAQVELSVDRHCETEVVILHNNSNELPNLEGYIKRWLDKNTDPQGEWQGEYDTDIWRGVDPGCDPAFPHYGDFERWAYGRGR